MRGGVSPLRIGVLLLSWRCSCGRSGGRRCLLLETLAAGFVFGLLLGVFAGFFSVGCFLGGLQRARIGGALIGRIAPQRHRPLQPATQAAGGEG